MLYKTSKGINDEWKTPIYAITPLEKYVKRNSTIWCPFDTANSEFVKVLKNAGHKVIHTILEFKHENECPNIDKDYPFPKNSNCLENCIKKNDFLDFKKHDSLFFKKDIHIETRYSINNYCIDYIISNPPFSIKTKVLEKLYELNIPFAMLLPVPSLDGLARFSLFKKYGLELLVFNKRISFNNLKQPTFGSAYFCWNTLPKQLILEELERE